MTANLTYHVQQAHLDELHRRAAEARSMATVAPRKESRHRLLTSLREALG